MSQQIPGFSSIDPLAAPLPHGTEVTTRVERILPQARIPRGVVGRVVKLQEDSVGIQITGFGTIFYRRDELIPRRPGQIRFAIQREADWNSLKSCVILQAVVGSRAWGLAEEDSDTDQRGLIALPFSWRTGLSSPPDCIVSADGSATFWDFSKAIRQALRADPNTLELLYVSTVHAVDPAGEWILQEREAFVSAEIFGSFGRYALSQLNKLSQSQRLAEHRGLLLDWLRVQPAPDLDEVARRLAEISPRKDSLVATKEYIKQLYRSLYDQGLIRACDFASLVDYACQGGRQPEPGRELRPKNAYNLLRLIAVATEWLQTGRPQLEMRGAMREQLLEIKRGQLPLEEVIRYAEEMIPALEKARDSTPLPPKPDIRRADQLLRRLHEEFARRWVTQVPGPWGAQAPLSPAPQLEE